MTIQDAEIVDLSRRLHEAHEGTCAEASEVEQLRLDVVRLQLAVAGAKEALERIAAPVTDQTTRARRREWAFRRNLAGETLAKLAKASGGLKGAL